MKIEKAIQQSKAFASPYQRAGVNLIYTHNWLVARMKRFFAEFGVTMKQYNIMRILKGAGQPVSTAYIRERLLDMNSDVSRIVDRMDDKGWIIKETCPDDKRLVDLKLSKEGMALLNKINERIEVMNDFLSGLNRKEVELLNDLLDKIRVK